MTKLNTKLITHAKAKSAEYKLSDGNGLFLRVRTSGAKSWLFCFRLHGDRRMVRMTLGSLEDVSLKEAREQLIELRKLVSQGIDPRSARAAAITKNVQAMTMQSLFEAWIEFTKQAGDITPAWINKHENRWRLHLKTLLGNLLAKDVTRAHLATALDAMIRKGIKEETRKALTTLNLMLDYGLTRHIIEQNPARVLKPKDFSATANRPRDRALSILELRKLWKALDQAITAPEGIASTSAMTKVTTTAIKMLIVTGARRGEVAAMQWDEIDFVERIWTLPSSKTKNRQSHKIYLSAIAIQLLEELKPVTGHSTYVFNTGRDSSLGHIHQDTLTSVVRRLKNPDKTDADKSPLVDVNLFTIHDLRRSAATAWGEYLKVEPHVIERMLNHQPLNKLVATYQRAVYVKEQKAAWMAWGNMVERQIAKSQNNVIPITRVATR